MGNTKVVGFNESVVDGYTGFIFQNRYGDPLSPHSVNRAIDRICAAYIEDETVLADQEGRDPVLIRHFSAHNLRHTFCTGFVKTSGISKSFRKSWAMPILKLP